MIKSLPLLPAGLLFLVVILGILLIVQTALPVVTPRVVQTGMRDSPTKEAAVYAPLPLEAFHALQARPPFSPSRRPARILDATLEANSKPPQVRLLGVITGGGARIAVTKRPSSKDVANLRSGDEIDGWAIAEISEERLLLRKGDKTHEIWLDGSPREKTSGGQGLVRVHEVRPRDE